LDIKPKGRGPANSLPVTRIRPAYHQIAEQIRDLIIEGRLKPAQQLPSEEQLSADFGVSRNTIREALRTLSSQGLIATSRGVLGGSFVAMPDPFVVRHNLESGLGLLRASETISPQELFDTRALLELPATRWAAERRTDADLERMRDAARGVEAGRLTFERAERSGDFHQAVLDAAGNRLLSMIAPPVWRVFAVCAVHSGEGNEMWPDIDHDHAEVLRHIEHQDADAAEAAMRTHLERLRDSAK